MHCRCAGDLADRDASETRPRSTPDPVYVRSEQQRKEDKKTRDSEVWAFLFGSESAKKRFNDSQLEQRARLLSHPASMCKNNILSSAEIHQQTVVNGHSRAVTSQGEAEGRKQMKCRTTQVAIVAA